MPDGEENDEVLDDAERSRDEELNQPLLSSQDDRLPVSGMLLYCSLNFFHGISGVTWGRFGIIYYNEIRHLSDEQIGFLQGVIPLISLVSQPFWGTMADWFQSKKSVYLICKAASTLALLALSMESIVQTFSQILLCVAAFGSS